MGGDDLGGRMANAQDATLRNVKASRKRDDALDRRVSALELALNEVLADVERLKIKARDVPEDDPVA